MTAWNQLHKEHKLPAKRLARALEQLEGLKIQIAEEEDAHKARETARQLAVMPPPPPNPVEITAPEPASNPAGPWWLLAGSGLLGAGAGVIFASAERDYQALKVKLEPNEKGKISHNRDALIKEQDGISLLRNLSLGLGLGAGIALVSGLIWLNSDQEITVNISPSSDGGQVGLAGHF